MCVVRLFDTMVNCDHTIAISAYTPSHFRRWRRASLPNGNKPNKLRVSVWFVRTYIVQSVYSSINIAHLWDALRCARANKLTVLHLSFDSRERKNTKIWTKKSKIYFCLRFTSFVAMAIISFHLVMFNGTSGLCLFHSFTRHTSSSSSLSYCLLARLLNYFLRNERRNRKIHFEQCENIDDVVPYCRCCESVSVCRVVSQLVLGHVKGQVRAQR